MADYLPSFEEMLRRRRLEEAAGGAQAAPQQPAASPLAEGVPPPVDTGVFHGLDTREKFDAAVLGGFFGFGGGATGRANDIRTQKALAPFQEAVRAELANPDITAARKTELLGMLANTEASQRAVYDREPSHTPRAIEQYQRDVYGPNGVERRYGYEQSPGHPPNFNDPSQYESTGVRPLWKPASQKSASKGASAEQVAAGMRALVKNWPQDPNSRRKLRNTLRDEYPASIWRDVAAYDPQLMYEIFGNTNAAPGASQKPKTPDELYSDFGIQ